MRLTVSPWHLSWFLTIFLYMNSLSAAPSIKHKLDMGHGVFVRALAFSPNGQTLAVACGQDENPGQIRLYSVHSGQLLATFTGHRKAVNCVGFTPDGKLLVSGGSDNKCLIWNTATHKKMNELNGHTEIVIALSIDPKGTEVATSGFDNKILLWDLASGKQLFTLDCHGEMIGRLAHSPDGKLLVGGSDGTIRVWDSKTKKELREWKAHDKLITSLEFTHNGQYLATCSRDGRVKLWDTKDWLETAIWQMGNEEPVSLGVSSEGKLMVVGSSVGEVVFFNTSEEAIKTTMNELPKTILLTRTTYRAHNSAVNTVSFSPDGKMLASGSIDASVKLWIDLPGN
jgi:WD40 repeat protein